MLSDKRSFPLSSEPVYSAKKPTLSSVLPATARRDLGGIETLRVPPQRSELFGNSVRHFGMVCRPHSASTIALAEGNRERILGVLMKEFEVEELPVLQGVPIPPVNREFFVPYPIDLFPGGQRTVLDPGRYRAGEFFGDEGCAGKVYLEITAKPQDGSREETFSAVVGLFHQQRDSAGVDWRRIVAV